MHGLFTFNVKIDSVAVDTTFAPSTFQVKEFP